jgi:hypothetical protein
MMGRIFVCSSVMYVGLILGVDGGWQLPASGILGYEKIISEKLNYNRNSYTDGSD